MSTPEALSVAARETEIELPKVPEHVAPLQLIVVWGGVRSTRISWLWTASRFPALSIARYLTVVVDATGTVHVDRPAGCGRIGAVGRVTDLLHSVAVRVVGRRQAHADCTAVPAGCTSLILGAAVTRDHARRWGRVRRRGIVDEREVIDRHRADGLEPHAERERVAPAGTGGVDQLACVQFAAAAKRADCVQ